MIISENKLFLCDSGNGCVKTFLLEIVGDEILAKSETIIVKQLQFPEGICFRDLSFAEILVCDSQMHQILSFNLYSQQITFICANTVGYEDGKLENAKFHSPCHLCCVNQDIYVCDRDNHCIREIKGDSVRTITAVQRGFMEGQGGQIRMNEPNFIFGFRCAYFTRLLICDLKNACIRELIDTNELGNFLRDEFQNNEPVKSINQTNSGIPSSCPATYE